jgi:hypothetical protein
VIIHEFERFKKTLKECRPLAMGATRVAAAAGARGRERGGGAWTIFCFYESRESPNFFLQLGLPGAVPLALRIRGHRRNRRPQPAKHGDLFTPQQLAWWHWWYAHVSWFFCVVGEEPRGH